MRRNCFPYMLALMAGAGALATGLSWSPATAASILASQSFEGFTAAGLTPGGGDGLLDSNRWSVLGFSDGDSAFGNHATAGDLARGQAGAPVRSGGLYAFALPDDAVGLGIQATSSDFSPGALVWRIENSGESTWTSLSLGFDLWLRNDGDRATGLSVDLNLEDQPGPWITLPGASHATPAVADNLGWQRQHLETALPGLLAPGASLLLRFKLADAAGTGVRDELAFTDFQLGGELETVTPVALALPGGLSLMASSLLMVSLASRRRTMSTGPASTG